jgi:hypothetical protein
MWRLAIVVCLLSSSAVLAGETTGQLHVGFTITGGGRVPTAGSAPTGLVTGSIQGPVPLPPERPAALGRNDTAPSGR